MEARFHFLRRGSDTHCAVFVAPDLQLPSPGIYAFVLSINGQEADRIHLSVALREPEAG